MKRLVIAAFLTALAVSAFGGVVTGSLIYPEGTEADTFLIIVASDFSSLDGAFMAPAFYPFDWTMDDALMEGEFSDTVEYFAFASKPSGGIIPTSGDPGGSYPESPFSTVGGNASGIDIPIAPSADVSGNVVYRHGYSQVYIMIYDLLQAYITGDTVLEIGPELVNEDGTFLIEDVPTGPKGIRAFEDLNMNGEIDDGEPNAWYDNYLMGVVIVGGGMTEEPELDLDAFGMKDAPRPEKFAMSVFPNPFNSRVRLAWTMARTDFVEITAWDMSGRKVATLHSGSLADGSHFTEWDAEGDNGEPIATGTYTIRMRVGDEVHSQNVIIVK